MTKDEMWAIGLFEGEGCISITKNNGRTFPDVTLCSTDKDTIDNFHSIINFGNLTGPYKRRKGTKPIWRWRLTQNKQIENLLERWLPFLSSRRRMRAIEVLTLNKERLNDVKEQRSRCKKGHLKDDKNTYIYNNLKFCKKCRKMAVDAYRNKTKQRKIQND